jgi:acyl dehydratase
MKTRERLTPGPPNRVPRELQVYSVELEPISFDDLPLGGEWTTRRRTISESEIALFAAVAGDFSPLTVDTSGGEARLAPPAMIVALAVGLGSMDMPIPHVATWEWVNWKFPKAVRAGETIYARWTLTQKRPPVHGAPTGIAVWRVDVHTADGAMCAEGEIGAAVTRRAGAVTAPDHAEATTGARRRRRGRRGGGTAAETQAKAAPAPPAQNAAVADRAPRRRRRKRSGSASGSGNGNGNGDHSPAKPPDPAPTAAPVVATPGVPATPAAPAEGPLTRVMRRLRRT